MHQFIHNNKSKSTMSQQTLFAKMDEAGFKFTRIPDGILAVNGYKDKPENVAIITRKEIKVGKLGIGPGGVSLIDPKQFNHNEVEQAMLAHSKL